MGTERGGNGISKNEIRDSLGQMHEPFVFENIFFVGSQIGKGFREGYARILLDSMVDGIIVFDEFWKIQAFNPFAEKFFSYTADEVQMENINILIPKLNSESNLQQFMENEKNENQNFGKEVTGIRKNGFAVSLRLLVNKIDFNGCFLHMAIIRKE